MDLLNLRSLHQDVVRESGHDYHIEASSSRTDHLCLECGCADTVGFGRKRQLFMDAPVRGKRVGIWVDRRRLGCKQCGKTFMEPLPEMDDRRQATRRLAQYIERESLRRTFASIAEDVGFDEKSIRNIFRDYINQLEREVRFETPRWMDIDEIHIVKKPRCVISNIEHQTIVEVLPNRNKPTVTSACKRCLVMRRCGMSQRICGIPSGRRQHGLPASQDRHRQVSCRADGDQCLDTIRKSLRAALTSRQRKGLMHDRFVLLKRRHDISDEDYLKLSG